jgi:hypothetical protein
MRLDHPAAWRIRRHRSARQRLGVRAALHRFSPWLDKLMIQLGGSKMT